MTADYKLDTLHPLGLHGDKYLLDLVDALSKQISIYMELGTYVGNTMCYLAKRYPNSIVYSCEAKKRHFDEAAKNLRKAGIWNASLFHEKSSEFLRRAHVSPQCTVFIYHDAHGFGIDPLFPLEDDLKFSLGKFDKAIMVIDDYNIPDRPDFTCWERITWDLIREVLDLRRRTYTCVVPNYKEKTSPYHPLTGYILIAYGGVKVPRLEGFDVFNYEGKGQ